MKKLNKIPALKITLLVALLLVTATMPAQDEVPQSMDYQAVARDMNGYPIANEEVMVEVTIRSDWEEGEIVWQEIHSVVTNEFGLFSLEIGKGKSTMVGTAESFETINWSDNSYFIQTRVDFGGQRFGDGLVNMGVSKFQSVPYAFLADSAMKAPPAKLNMGQLQDVDTLNVEENQALVWNGTTWIPGDIQGDYVRLDGTTDLTGDWGITGNSITITSGDLTATGLIGNSLSVGGTQVVEGFSTDTSLGGSNPVNSLVPTQNAIKTYVDNSMSGGAWTSDGTYLYNLDKKIGIGTSTPDDKFHADIGKEGFQVTGTYDAGTTTNFSGAGTVMAFFANKAAFRAGRVKEDNDAWNDNYIGNYSFAGGLDVRAEGTYAASFGYKNNSSGSRAFSAGGNNLASGISSVAIGYNNAAEGAYSIALGNNVSATGQAASAIGYNTEADGMYSLALGQGSSTSNNAIGAIAGGKDASTSGNHAIALGHGTQASTMDEVAVGRYNYSVRSQMDAFQNWYGDDQVFSVGVGELTARSNAFVVMKNGNVGIGLGQSAPSTLLQVGKSGDMTVAKANEWLQFSDRRLKKNVHPISNPLEKVTQLNGYYYHWRNKTDTTRQVGAMAQEVEKVLPELVHEDAEGIKSLNYSRLTALLIEAVKAQQKTIEQLRGDKNSLKAEVEQLESNYKKLDRRIRKLEDLLKYTQK